MKKKQKKPKGGDCFKAAALYMLDMAHMGAQQRYLLVHAEVAGQGPLKGLTYAHAFVVDTDFDTVIDNSNKRNIELPKIVYYAIGSIDRIQNIREYTYQQMAEMLNKYQHYGPWELITEQ